MSGERNTTHEYVCVECDAHFKGREVNGEIHATNAAPSGEVKPCLCFYCHKAEEAAA